MSGPGLKAIVGNPHVHVNLKAGTHTGDAQSDMIIHTIMSTQRFTITLPEHIGKRIQKRAREQKKPVSRVIAEDLDAAERERIRQEMIKGYIATREENRRIAEEWWPIAGETWPVD